VNPPPFATHWARELGTKEESLIQLKGGINNRVYRCGKGTDSYVIKGYSPTAGGLRDRMRAEVEFLIYAAKVAPQYVPKLIHVDLNRRCVVLEHIEGTLYPEGKKPSSGDIKAAVDFFRQLNEPREVARKYILLDAADGFLRLTEHIDNIRERLSRMSTNHLPNNLKAYGGKLYRLVQEATIRTAEKLETLIDKGRLADSIIPEQRCVSPSDFGFHNAIRTASHVKFIDFEFAGWDDPAKTCADFILQPRVPIGLKKSPLEEVVNTLKPEDQMIRADVLKTILSLKWVCITLAILDQERLDGVLALHSKDAVGRLLTERFRQAQNMLDKLI